MQPLEYYLNTEEVPPGGVGPCLPGQRHRHLRQYPAPPDLHSCMPAEFLHIVQELGRLGLCHFHFHGAIGLRSARRYGINPWDAWN